jgi:hypothetical protein
MTDKLNCAWRPLLTFNWGTIKRKDSERTIPMLTSRKLGTLS